MKKATLQLKIEYDPEITDPESLADVLDSLIETSISQIPLVEYGNPVFGDAFVV